MRPQPHRIIRSGADHNVIVRTILPTKDSSTPEVTSRVIEELVRRRRRGTTIKALAASTGYSAESIRRILSENESLYLPQKTSRQGRARSLSLSVSKEPQRASKHDSRREALAAERGASPTAATIIIDKSPEEFILSWTAACSPHAFMMLAQKLMVDDDHPKGAIIAAGRGRRVTADMPEALGSDVAQSDSILRRHCDFMRFDFARFSLAYQDFLLGAPASDNHRLVSLVAAANSMTPFKIIISTTVRLGSITDALYDVASNELKEYAGAFAD